ncbi:MAG: dTDP-4-dehydrorhamnose 3,5-epimerase [Tannerellaceae bacterium]|nr:dTDP-4-dehydrorhamnose 3,5-epimerase [Tannerellaceae bacterium]
MKYHKTILSGVYIIEPTVFYDTRGYFMEAFKAEEFCQQVGNIRFIQENESSSSGNVIRGLHYQLEPWAQAKLVRVICGSVLDVVVDLRTGSPTYGKALTEELSADNKKQIFIPKGCAHGFRVLSETAVFTYKVYNPYMPAFERTIRFDDPFLAIDWQLQAEDALILSPKDQTAPLFAEAETNFSFEK